MKKILSLIITLGLSLSISIFGSTNTKTELPKEIKNIISITEPSGFGEKLTAVAIELEKPVKNSSLNKNSFSIENRTITDIYTSNVADFSKKLNNGNFIIIELSKDEESAKLRVAGNRGGFKANEPNISIKQNLDFSFENGEKFKFDNTLINKQVKRLIVDDFKQLEFKDVKTGITLKYNLFIPKNYDPNKKYPLVLFMHDASVESEETTATLRQGNGATVWASPEFQAKNEAFVLAPQYPVKVVNDNWEATEHFDTTYNLLQNLIKEYSIDQNRLYTTGQSMGGMMSILFNVKYPDLFAASYFVACQWDYMVVSPMSKNNIWITVSTGDLKAYPGMNAITTVYEQNDGIVAKAMMRGNFSNQEFNRATKEIISKNPNANIFYTTLEKDTIPGVIDSKRTMGAAEHVYTWTVAYNIEGIREWLFSKTK